MPATFHIEIINRAKALYAQGFSPAEIVRQFAAEKDSEWATFYVPTERSTINRWAKAYQWAPHWREARKALKGEDQTGPFARSGINDPIWHLAENAAKWSARRYAVDYLPVPIGVIVNHVLLHVTAEVNPGPRVCRELIPLIRETITKARRDYEQDNESAIPWRDSETTIKDSLDEALKRETAKKLGGDQ